MMSTSNSNAGSSENNSYQEKVRKIADRIWKIWQKDLRNERERRGKKRR